MKACSLFHLSDGALRRDLFAAVARSRAGTAMEVAHIGEFDARRLYAAEGYPSMHRFCVCELHLSEDAAFRRIQVARKAREFPAIFAMLADGRLHLSAVLLLSAHLTRETADRLLAAAEHRSKREIEQWLAERFPKDDVPEQVTPIPPATDDRPAAAVQAGARESDGASDPVAAAACGPASTASAAPKIASILQPVAMQGLQLAPERVGRREPFPRVTPLAPERFAVQFTVSANVNERLQYAQALLRSRIPAAGIPDVLAHALEALIPQLEKARFAATDRPRKQRVAARGRTIPAAIKREVWKRDGGRCAFVAGNGRRCSSRDALEFDHVQPVARGGRTTAGNLRLLCRAHNQYAAGQVFGEGFMHQIRERAGRAGTEDRSFASGPAPEARESPPCHPAERARVSG